MDDTRSVHSDLQSNITADSDGFVGWGCSGARTASSNNRGGEPTFPSFREGFRRSRAELDETKSVHSDLQSNVTADSDGFVGWGRPRANTASSNNEGGESTNSSSIKSSSKILHVMKHPIQPPEISSSAHGSDQYKTENDNSEGDVAVEFPEDRSPFRRKSLDSLGSAMSGYNSSVCGGSNANNSRISKHDNDASDSESGTASDSLQRSNSSLLRRASEDSGATNDVSLSNSKQPQRRSRSGSRDHRRSLDTINSDKSFSTSSRQNSDLRQSLRESLVKQSSLENREILRASLKKQESASSLRRSLERKDAPSPRPRSRSKEAPMKRRPSLGQLHDDNVDALPILGWDKDVDDSESSSMLSKSVMSHRSSLHKSKSDRSGMRESAASGFVSWGASVPESNGLKNSLLNDSMHSRGVLSHSQSIGSMASSLKASQVDSYHDGVYEDFRARESFLSSSGQLVNSFASTNENNNGNRKNRDLLMMMMEEEYDAKKPWRKAPPAGEMPMRKNAKGSPQKNDVGQSGARQGMSDRRTSGITMRSSFTSDMSYGDLMQTEMQQYRNHRGDLGETEPIPETDLVDSSTKRGMTATEALAKMGKKEDDVPVESVSAKNSRRRDSDEAVITHHMESDGDTFRTSKTQMSVTSSLDDDGSELTELRQAQQALFSVMEGDASEKQSVISSEISFENRNEPAFLLTRESSQTMALASSFVSRASSASSFNAGNNELSSSMMSNVKEDSLYRQSEHSLPPVNEDGSDGDIQQLMEEGLSSPAHISDNISDLDELPTSASARNGPLKKSFRNKGGVDDDSVSYSDIDDHAPAAAPSIKMCMTVRDSTIESEFATEQLGDVEFGETKTEEEMTLQDLLEGNGGDTYNKNSNNSIRSNGGKTSSSKRSSKLNKSTSKSVKTAKKSVKKSISTQSAGVRRKNKRLWKFCVWNCRKITICLVLGLVLLIGVALLVWWGVTRAKSEGGDGDIVQGGQVEEENTFTSNNSVGTSVPTKPLQDVPSGMPPPSLSPSRTDSAGVMPPQSSPLINETANPSNTNLSSSTDAPFSVGSQAPAEVLSISPTEAKPNTNLPNDPPIPSPPPSNRPSLYASSANASFTAPTFFPSTNATSYIASQNGSSTYPSMSPSGSIVPTYTESSYSNSSAVSTTNSSLVDTPLPSNSSAIGLANSTEQNTMSLTNNTSQAPFVNSSLVGQSSNSSTSDSQLNGPSFDSSNAFNASDSLLVNSSDTVSSGTAPFNASTTSSSFVDTPLPSNSSAIGLANSTEQNTMSLTNNTSQAPFVNSSLVGQSGNSSTSDTQLNGPGFHSSNAFNASDSLLVNSSDTVSSGTAPINASSSEELNSNSTSYNASSIDFSPENSNVTNSDSLLSNTSIPNLPTLASNMTSVTLKINTGSALHMMVRKRERKHADAGAIAS